MPSIESTEIRKHIHKETTGNEMTLAEQRNAWIEYAKTQALHKDVTAQEENIAGVPCLWLSKTGTANRPIIIYLHGGGLVDGAITTHREFVSRLVAITGHRALILDYRLAPEHPFPAALEDVLSVYDALILSRQVDPQRIVLGGDSSGGGLAIAAMMQLVREKKGLPLCGFTLSGVFDLTLSGESMVSRDEKDPCLSHEALKEWIQHFEGCNLSDHRLSPLFGDANNLPPILLQAGDHEVWLDDSVRMAKKLTSSGCTASIKVWDSMWHVWPMYSELPEAREAIEEIGRFIYEKLSDRAIASSESPTP